MMVLLKLGKATTRKKTPFELAGLKSVDDKLSGKIVRFLFPSKSKTSEGRQDIISRAKKGREAGVRLAGIGVAGAAALATPVLGAGAIPLIGAGITAAGAPRIVSEIIKRPALALTAAAGITAGGAGAAIVGAEQGADLISEVAETSGIKETVASAVAAGLAGVGIGAAAASPEIRESVTDFFTGKDDIETLPAALPSESTGLPAESLPSAVPVAPVETTSATPRKRRKSRLKAQGQKISQSVRININNRNSYSKKYIKAVAM